MIKLTNSVAQTIPAGGTVTFDQVFKTRCGTECYNRQIPNSVKLRANGLYEIHFSGNIASPTAATPVQLAIALGGVAQPDTVMEVNVPDANAFNNVATATSIQVCCCDLTRVTVVNSGTNPVLLSANMNLLIKRIG